MNHAKLKRLKVELDRCRDNASDQLHADYPKHRATVERRVGHAPAIHGTAMKFLDGIWRNRAVLSRQKTGRKPLKHQPCFETQDAVYASVGVMYPGREAALVFSPRIETDSSLRVEASPWDTGMFYLSAAALLGLQTDAARRQVYRDHTLPAPLYREYLIDYVATCFGCADDYLRGALYRHADPARVMATLPEQALLRVFELHVYTRLPLDLDRIEAVFLRSAKSLTSLQRKDMVPRLRRAGITVEYYGRGPTKGRESNATADDLRAYITEWMCDRRPTRSPAP